VGTSTPCAWCAAFKFLRSPAQALFHSMRCLEITSVHILGIGALLAWSLWGISLIQRHRTGAANDIRRHRFDGSQPDTRSGGGLSGTAIHVTLGSGLRRGFRSVELNGHPLGYGTPDRTPLKECGCRPLRAEVYGSYILQCSGLRQRYHAATAAAQHHERPQGRASHACGHFSSRSLRR